MPRIAIGGAHGSGKTTFCHRLIEALGGAPVLVPDIARSCTLPVGGVSNTEAQTWVLRQQLELESIFAASDDIVIFDGFSGGHLAYFHHWQGWDPDLESRARTSSEGLDRIFWLPPRPEFLIADGLRPVDPAFQRTIADRQLDILTGLNAPVERVPEAWVEWTESQWQAVAAACRRSAPEPQVQNKRQMVVGLGRIRREDRILTVRRRAPEIPGADNLVDLPGGKLCYGEDPATAVAREVFEETGYLVRAERLIPCVHANRWALSGGGEHHAIILCFDCILLQESPFPILADKGVREIEWKRPEEIDEVQAIPGVKKFLSWT